MRYCVFDFETYSEAPLSKVGAFEYAAHPSTKVLCAAWQILDANKRPLYPAESANLVLGDSLDALKRELAIPDTIGVAHNLMFELAICKMTLGWNIELGNWEDTAVLASAFGLPRSLKNAALALSLPQQKMDTGVKLIKLLCMPSPKDFPVDQDYRDLENYCVQDVRTQVALFQKLPELSSLDRTFWQTNLRMNLRGFQINRPFAYEADKLLNERYLEIDAEFKQLTGIISATKTAATLNWLKKEGYTPGNLTKQSVGEFITSDPKITRVLELRSQRSKAAVKKYAVMLERSGYDGRARDTTIFYGAHTGRDAGVGLQPQNLAKARGDLWEVDFYIEKILAGKTPPKEEIIPVLADCVRGTIEAKTGHKLVVADFAGIELRVLFWMADHKAGLDAVRAGKDLYKEMASVIYHKPVDQVTKAERQLGKQAVLGAGFGIGVNGEKFQAAAKTYGMDISIELAQRSIKAYRTLHSPIPDMWKDTEWAAVKAVTNPGKRFTGGFVEFLCSPSLSHLKAQLPSGRYLYYQRPMVTKTQGMYGDRLELSFVGVHGPAKKFERRKTWGGTLVENVVQAVARDILYASLVRLEGVADAVLAVHDEGVFETPQDFDPRIIQDSMEIVPLWARGLPINVEVWEGRKYGK